MSHSDSPEDSSPDAPAGERWLSVIAADAVPEGGAVEVLVEDQIVAIFRLSGALYALDGMCAHQGGPIAQGTLERTSDGDPCVTCPWHGWQYELKTGVQTINRQPLQKTFPARELDGQIQLLI